MSEKKQYPDPLQREREREKERLRVHFSEAISVHAQENELLNQDLKQQEAKYSHLWQDKTDDFYAHIESSVFKVERSKVILPPQEWITMGDFMFPEQSFLPKIHYKETATAKVCTTAIRQENLRRLYASQSLTELLKTMYNITSKDLEPTNLIIPGPSPIGGRLDAASARPIGLQDFDDNEFDDRLPEEWLGLGIVEGTVYPVPGKAFICTRKHLKSERGSAEEKVYHWCHVAVLDYDYQQMLYKVSPVSRDNDDPQFFNVPRIYLYFMAEDPMKFAARVRFAFKRKTLMEENLRFERFLNSSHFQDLTSMQFRFSSQFRKLILSGKKMKDLKLESKLMSEVNENHIHVIKRLIAKEYLKSNPEHFEGVKLTVPTVDDESGMGFCTKPTIVKMQDFKQVAENFRWGSLFVINETYQALSYVEAECLAMADMCLFDFQRNVTLHEFESIQTHTMSNIIDSLHTSWVRNIAHRVTMCLRDVGRGWFNIKQSDRYVYKISKLARLMDLIELRMQSAIRSLVLKSVTAYTEFIEGPCLCTYDLPQDFVWNEDLSDSKFRTHPIPIFHMELKLDDTETYNDQLGVTFLTVILNLLECAITASHHIPSVKPFVLIRQQLTKNQTLTSVGHDEEEICALRRRLEVAVRFAIIPLKAYCRKFSTYVQLYSLNVDAYIEKFNAENHPANEVKDEIALQFRLKEELEQSLPTSIVIGPFQVYVEPVKKVLVGKRQEMATRLLATFAQRLTNNVEEVMEEYLDIYQRLNTKPTSIEHILEIKDWMETIPVSVKAQEDIIRRYLLEYEVLDSFWWALEDNEFEAKWEAHGWPRRIQKKVEETQLYLEKETNVFKHKQLEDQLSLEDQLETINVEINRLQMLNDVDAVHEIANDVRKNWKTLKDLQEFGQLLNQRQTLFGMPMVPYDAIKDLIREFEPYRNLWVTASDWLKSKEIYVDNPLGNIDADSIDRVVNDYYKNIIKALRVFNEIPAMLKVAQSIKTQIEEFKPHIPLIKALKNPGLRQWHMDELSKTAGFQVSLNTALTFQKCLQMGITEHFDEVMEISDNAAKEYVIEEALEKIENEWKDTSLEVNEYKNTDTYIMKVADETLQMLDDHTIVVQQLSFSPFKGALEKKIDEWEAKLRYNRLLLEEWMNCQKRWMWLEPIFTSEDITKQLPQQSKKFRTMDRSWRRIMKNASMNKNVLVICSDERLFETLKDCNKILDLVERGLSDYLEMKRGAFPRFYFLSDDELLEILSQAKNPLAVQPHLRKCFENIQKLEFLKLDVVKTKACPNPVDLEITKMFSAEGESVDLIPHMQPEGNVEQWLLRVEEVMRNTIRVMLGRALGEINKIDRSIWVLSWPGQVVIACCQAYWTAQVENAILEGSLSEYMDAMKEFLNKLRILVKGPLKRVERQVLSALIVIEVHARDVLTKLIDLCVTSCNEFDWISQLRYYWIETEMKVRAVNAEFSYGYEYLGNSGRLVITPLTDRCYLTLTGALHLKFGGAPAGPAGTGKTETTKDLAKAFAIQCVVFNCSDQLDVRAMGKFFKGLASSGAWACFDEFNRIDIEVLSVVAQQITTIQKAQMMRADRFFFEGCELVLKPSCAVFITMNPGYAGRTELPDNLKALFRPVAMMVPDYTLIAEISLFSFGFSEAKPLAGKITTTFKLSSEQLSSQDHYDFGMRAVNSVLAVAGNLKRDSPNLDERQIVLRAIRDSNVPKFLKDDLTLFNGIVSDLFPGMVEQAVDYGDLEKSIREVILQMGFVDVDAYVRKVIQLYETTVVRHGLMLVGPTGSGKTKCYEILKAAMTHLKGKAAPSGYTFETVHTYVLNPKSITMGQLYGEFDFQTHEWTDGILPSLMRVGASSSDSDKHWYVLDGPVDAVWIENMNTVLDDNKKLCLTSGEIIKMSPHQTMMFEVADLAVASPATVSRCGMVYLEPGLLGLSPFLASWLKRLPKPAEPYVDSLKTILENWLEPAIKFLRQQMKEMVHQVDSALFVSCLRLLDCFLRPLSGIDGHPPPPARLMELVGGLLTPWTIFSVIWSVGATCDYESRVVFSEWVRSKMEEQGDEPLFPEEGTVYDYRIHDGGFIMATEDGETCPPFWLHWLHHVEPYEITPEMRYPDIQVPTIDNVRNSHIIGDLLENSQNVLCIGPTGSGKTITIMSKLSTGMPKKFISDFLNFSARTSANQTQDIIDSKLDRRRKGVFGPPITKRLVLFIDDLNMPAPEVYGAQPPLELIRQWMDFHGWYDRRSVGEFRHIVDTNLLAAMGLAGGARNAISARLLRHFHLISFVEMQDDIKSCIFGKILNFWIDKIEPVSSLGSTLLSSTLAVYSTILRELLPTPAKTHYTFNLRDLSKVFQGMLMLAPNFIKNVDDLLKLWYHENCRVYQDRLVNDEDRSWFDDLLCSRIAEDFAMEPLQVVGDGPLLYGDFVGTSIYKVYQPITDMIKLSTELDEFLDDYNSQSRAPMKLVLFLDAITHVCRISRIIRQPLGNGLLLGMAGSGRQSLTRLAAYMSEFFCFQIELTKSYSSSEWREDIKQLMLKAGLYNRESVFLFADTQIKSESFLEDLNSILNSGDVPNIYQADELDKIYQSMQGAVTEAGLPTTRSNLYSCYLKLVRSNLHCVITMSPIGEVFRARLRQFPELVNCCTIDWFSAWPQSALQSVALQFLDEMPELDVSPEVQDGIVITFRYMHQSVVEASTLYLQELSRHNYVTPTSYLELLSSYGSMMTKKKEELQQGIKRLQAGLDKLLSTAQEVKVLQKELAEMKPKLEAAQVAADDMLKQIEADTAVAEETRAMVEVQETDALKIASEAQAIADDAAADLEQAMPMLRAAEESLKSLNRNDVTEVKAMKRPPAGVVLVIEVISIIMDIKPRRLSGPIPGQKILDYWEPGRNMLNDPGAFLNSLMNYDKENMSESLINKLKPYINNPQFQPSKIITVSKACTSLCMWVHAIFKYFFVNQTVLPKKAALASAKIKLASVMSVLEEKRARMKEVTDGLAELEKALKETMDHKAQLEANAKLCENRMDRAFRLINGLADERERWINTISVLERSVENMVGDILISAGAVAYLTPFTDKYRRGLLSEWLKQLEETHVAHTARCTPVQTLGEAVAIRQWQLSALPRDYLSTENAILSFHSRRWPLFIDPQGQANRWIKNIGKSTGLKVCKLHDKDLMRALQSAVRFGKEVLIENVLEELDPALDTILTRQTFVQNNQLVMRIGDLNVPYCDTFRLYITTKLPNPHYMPEVSIKVLLVNFTLVPSGLEDQMLALVVMQERPDLEEERSAIVVGLAEMKNELKQIEDRILLKLSSSQGSPVDDIDLILTLEGSKVKSEEIKAKVEAAEITESNIEVTRRLYIPVAKRAQILFFCLADLALIDPMYQYSLEWFIQIFIQSTVQTEKSGEIDERVETINDHFTFNLYSKVCQSLFEKNKLQYALLICARIMLDAGTLDPHDWMFFLTGGVPKKDIPNPEPSWLPVRAWQEILSLGNLPVFKDFAESFSQYAEDFKRIFDSAEPQRMPLPGEWNSKLDDFKKMIVLKCLRPDKVTNAIQEFLVSHLGQQFIEPRTTDLEVMFADSNSTTPLIFVLSTGTDPAADLYKFADKNKMTKRMMSISLGQGQGPIAENMLLQSIEIGNWIFFQNCHLAPSWMPRLEYLMDNIPVDTVHKDFRVWLTSAPSPAFPVSILQNGSKMTVEPPRGIKANMLRAFTGQVMEYNNYLQSGKPKVQSFKWLLFSLCLFHGVCLERRKFGPLGFNIPYEFTDGDLRICISQLQMFIEEYNEVPFKVLSYTAGEINYGGRVTDDWDRRCIMNVLADFYKPEVMSDGYSFDGPDKIYHQLPEDTAIIDYVTYIRTLPVNDSTVLFGLHSNADISSAQAEAYSSLAVLLSMQPRVVGEEASNEEEVTAQLAHSILDAVPQPRGAKELGRIQKMYPVLYQESLNTVLVQEVIRFEKLLTIIHSTLKDLLKALKGLAILSEKLEMILNSLFKNTVPDVWASKAYPSLKHLGAWVSDLQARIAFINKWIQNGVPTSFWISGFFFPQAFLTGCLQNYARRKQIAIDSISYKFMVLDAQPKNSPKEGCVIHGLFLEGARWNPMIHKLDESFPKELYTDMPPIWLIPYQSQPGEEYLGYHCPVYKTLKRAGVLSTTGHSTNYVLAIDIPSDKPENHWIKRGVALICALDF